MTTTDIAWKRVIAAHAAFPTASEKLDPERYREIETEWGYAQEDFLALPATTPRDVARRLRLGLQLRAGINPLTDDLTGVDLGDAAPLDPQPIMVDSIIALERFHQVFWREVTVIFSGVKDTMDALQALAGTGAP